MKRSYEGGGGDLRISSCLLHLPEFRTTQVSAPDASGLLPKNMELVHDHQMQPNSC